MREKTMRILAFLFFAFFPTLALCDTDERLVRCEPYRNTVIKILRETGLPERFYFLMVAESGCRSKDVRSHRGAVGFWQMMPATGRAHGCSNLEDLECATKAAASYLKDLSTRFKDDDIIAAWNQGGHNFKNHGMTPEARGLIRRVKYLEERDEI